MTSPKPPTHHGLLSLHAFAVGFPPSPVETEPFCPQLEHHFFCETLLIPSQPYTQHFTSTFWSTQLRARRGHRWVFSSVSAVPRTQERENLYIGPEDCAESTLALSRLPEFVRH